MERGEALLDAITDDVMRNLNPNDDDCWHCGGEGYTHDCFDGFCEEAEIGCEDCSRECPECVLFKGKIAKAIREEVIKTNDVHVATAWLKSIGRWDDSITPERVQSELAAAAKPPADLSQILGEALRKEQQK
jgi:hypothetical protein